MYSANRLRKLKIYRVTDLVTDCRRRRLAQYQLGHVRLCLDGI